MNNPPDSDSLFPRTRWSLVLRANGSGEAGREALGELLQSYWRPLYLFARQTGCLPQDAEDAVQGFCARLIRQESLSTADPQAGRLRSFLLTSFKHHLTDEWRHRNREKRGGGKVITWSDTDIAVLEATVADGLSPDAAFDRLWVHTLLERALERLRAEYAARGRAAVLAKLEPLLSRGGADTGQAEMAEELGMTLEAVHQQVLRMRRRFRTLLEAEIAATTAREEDIPSEREHFLQVLAG